MQNPNLLTPPHMCVYKIEKFRTLSAALEQMFKISVTAAVAVAAAKV
jgi:hypothetical protein